MTTAEVEHSSDEEPWPQQLHFPKRGSKHVVVMVTPSPSLRKRPFGVYVQNYRRSGGPLIASVGLTGLIARVTCCEQGHRRMPRLSARAGLRTA